jgi:hypothetical protein
MNSSGGVRVGRGAVGRIRRSPEFFLLLVRTEATDSATAALAEAAQDIAGLSAGKEFGGARTPSFVSPVIPTPEGPLIQVDAEALSRRLLAEIPELVVRRLREQGVDDAVVDCPTRPGVLDELGSWPQGAVLHLHPFPGTRTAPAEVPSTWLDAAVDWLAAGADVHPHVTADVGGFQTAVALADARSLLETARRAGANCLLVRGDAAAHVRGVHLHHRMGPSLLLAAGGGAEDLHAAVPALRDVGRHLAERAAYAYLSVEPTLLALRRGVPTVGPIRETVVELVGELADEVALDAFHWQVLTAGHIARLGQPPPGARPLAGGAVEVAVGELDDWLPGSATIDDARARGRAVLDGLLVDVAEAVRLAHARDSGT